MMLEGGLRSFFATSKKSRKNQPTLKTNKRPQNVIINCASKIHNIFVVTEAESMQNLLPKTVSVQISAIRLLSCQGKRKKGKKEGGWVRGLSPGDKEERESQDHVTCTEREEQKQQQKTQSNSWLGGWQAGKLLLELGWLSLSRGCLLLLRRPEEGGSEAGFFCVSPPFFSLRLRLRRKCDDEDVCLLAIFLPLFCGECGCGVEEEEEEEEEGVRGPFLCGEIVAFVTKPLLGNIQIMKDTQLSGSQQFIFILVLGIQQLIRAYNSIPH